MDDSFAIDSELAGAVFAHLGLDPPMQWGAQQLAELSRAFSATIPAGSLAKLNSEGIPPGHDPTEVARGVLSDEMTSWSCHAYTTLGAALIEATSAEAAGPRVAVALAHRRDEAAARVDLHSLLVVHADDTWIVDLYHTCLPVRLGDGASASTALRTVSVQARAFWSVEVSGSDINGVVRYDIVCPRVDPRLMQAVCDISRTHSGVANRPSARLVTDCQVHRVSLDSAERPRLQTFDSTGLTATAYHASFADAYSALMQMVTTKG